MLLTFILSFLLLNILMKMFFDNSKSSSQFTHLTTHCTKKVIWGIFSHNMHKTLLWSHISLSLCLAENHNQL